MSKELYPGMSREEIIAAVICETKGQMDLLKNGPKYLLPEDPINELRRAANKLIVAAEIASLRCQPATHSPDI